MSPYVRSLAVALLASLADVAPLPAQSSVHAHAGFSSRIAQGAPPAPAGEMGDERRWSPAGRFWARAGLGTVGWFAGAFGGGFVGGTVFRTDCFCDDPGLREAIIGAAVGGVAGGSLLAAAPRFGSDCRFGTRLLLGALGAGLGTGAGVLLARVTEPELLWLTVPVSTGVGSAIALSGC